MQSRSKADDPSVSISRRVTSVDKNAQVPDRSDRFPLEVRLGLHPCCISPEELSSQCELRTQRRSGPGGQHRNKTSSGVFLFHAATGVTAEATERRSQADNRRVAFGRMRLKLALEVRTISPLVALITSQERLIRDRLRNRRMRVSQQHADYPVLISLLLNDLYVSGGQPSLLTEEWGVGSSAIVRFLKTFPPSWVFVNAIRHHHGRLPLK